VRTHSLQAVSNTTKGYGRANRRSCRRRGHSCRWRS